MATRIEPDAKFIEQALASGGADLKKCYQCATCTTVCDLSDENTPFPRQQMILAQWGQRERLAADRAVWLCHNCGRCTEFCPRGAHPGEVMGALRQQAVMNLSAPRILGTIANTPKLLPIVFLIPALIFAALALWWPKGAPTSEIEFANLFPVPLIEGVFWAVSIFVMAAFFVQARRFYNALRAAGRGNIVRGLFPAAVEIMRNERLKDCEADRSWRIGHLFMVWGFVGLAATDTVVGAGMILGLLRTPLDQTHRLKIAIHVWAVVTVVGLFLLLWRRWRNPEKRRSSTYFDWFFVDLMAAVVVTGFLSEALRLAQAAPVMFVVYFIHLVLVFALFLYAPYSKFAHFLYRVMAVASTEPWTPKRPRDRAEIDEEGEIPIYS